MKKQLLAILVASVSLANTSYGQVPVISSFSQNGELVCTNLLPGTMAVVEWAPVLSGTWTNNWAGLDAVAVDSNGTVRVRVPMFYRVRGHPSGSNVPTNMALVPAGPFVMGDQFNDQGVNETPVHAVYVSAFYIDQYEVTKALWNQVYEWGLFHGYSFEHGAQGKATNHPAYNMTWYDAVKWCNARSEKEGRLPAYYTNAAQTTVYRVGQVDVQNDWVKWNAGYRLPTEAEWEKAARGGASGYRFPWADADTIDHSRANYRAQPLSEGGPAYDVNPTRGYHPMFNDGVAPYTSPVDYFTPNGYGLYDMAGNLCELCWDWYAEYSSEVQTDPRGSISGSVRVLRGGSWFDLATSCRVASRSFSEPFDWVNNAGFRSVLPAVQP